MPAVTLKISNSNDLKGLKAIQVPYMPRRGPPGLRGAFSILEEFSDLKIDPKFFIGPFQTCPGMVPQT